MAAHPFLRTISKLVLSSQTNATMSGVREKPYCKHQNHESASILKKITSIEWLCAITCYVHVYYIVLGKTVKNFKFNIFSFKSF